MSNVVDLSHINDFYRHNIKCMQAKSVEDMNLMLKHKWVVSVYNHDIANMFVYYVDNAGSAQ